MTRRQITVTVISVIACTWKRSLCGYCALMQYYRFLLSFQQHKLQLWVCNLLSPKGVDMFRLYTFLWLCTQILMVLRGKTLCNPTWAMWLDPNFRSYFFLKTGDDARGGKHFLFWLWDVDTLQGPAKKKQQLGGTLPTFLQKNKCNVNSHRDCRSKITTKKTPTRQQTCPWSRETCSWKDECSLAREDSIAMTLIVIVSSQNQ